MTAEKLHHVWEYTDTDRRFWREHLEARVPRRIIDAHTHLARPEDRLEPMTEEKRRQYWVNEVSEPIPADTAERCLRTVFPDRRAECVAMGPPSLDYDIEAANEYLRAECVRRGWHALALLRPEWDADRIERELDRPGVIGVKPYYSLIGRDPASRDRHLEADIFDYLPPRALEVLDRRGAWVTLHVPKADRLPHPQNIRRIRQIRQDYPRVILVVAHLGRCYTLPHAREGLPPLAEDEGLYFDVSAVLNPDVLRLAVERIGPRRLLYGTDNPVFYMRGRRRWRGREYINYTSHNFHFNRDRHEPPEVEAGYTLFMYEALKALLDVCEECGLGGGEVEAVFHDNARRLIETATAEEE
ncbi:MAG: amidohydrolase family protein [Planctomycetota bacterium]